MNTPQLNPGSEPDLQKSPNKVYDDLLAHRDVVCVPYQRLSDARYFERCQCPVIELNHFSPRINITNKTQFLTFWVLNCLRFVFVFLLLCF